MLRLKMLANPGSKADTDQGPAHNISLNGVKDGSEEDLLYGKYTPSASLQATIYNQAEQLLEPGKKYFVDIYPAE